MTSTLRTPMAKFGIHADQENLHVQSKEKRSGARDPTKKKLSGRVFGDRTNIQPLKAQNPANIAKSPAPFHDHPLKPSNPSASRSETKPRRALGDISNRQGGATPGFKSALKNVQIKTPGNASTKNENPADEKITEKLGKSKKNEFTDIINTSASGLKLPVPWDEDDVEFPAGGLSRLTDEEDDFYSDIFGSPRTRKADEHFRVKQLKQEHAALFKPSPRLPLSLAVEDDVVWHKGTEDDVLWSPDLLPDEKQSEISSPLPRQSQLFTDEDLDFEFDFDIRDD